MIIEIANGSYRKGSEYDTVTSPGLLESLNKIIEWDHCLFPPKIVEGTKDEWEEDRDFLGNPPQLKVGNAFKFGNQLIGVKDENTLALIMSETGIGGLKRVWTESISEEIKIASGTLVPESVSYEKVEESDVPCGWEVSRVPYSTMKLIKERVFPGREDLFAPRKCCVKVTIQSSVIMYPITLYLRDWTIDYNPADLELQEEVDIITEELFSDMYSRFPRKKLSNENPYEKRNEAVREAKKISGQIIQQLDEEISRGKESLDKEMEAKDEDSTTFDEEETVEPFKGELYFMVDKAADLGVYEPETFLSLSDLPDGLRDSGYESFFSKFEKDFPEYEVAEAMESVYEVLDAGTENFADEHILEDKLKNHPDYKEGLWLC